ncbi:hypothetical protein GGR52DRAFT_526597 [Hypoxylon sp. FL1284]|nr:hypothetical protein GGR52DRAFT_526597 [Hypoxylon sp. FL1284]
MRLCASLCMSATRLSGMTSETEIAALAAGDPSCMCYAYAVLYALAIWNATALVVTQHGDDKKFTLRLRLGQPCFKGTLHAEHA